MRIGLIGADVRQRAVAAAFTARGDEVVFLGLDSPLCEVVVLPMPVSEDGVHLFGSGDLLTDWLARLRGRRVYGGRCSPQVLALAAQYGVELVDHYKQEAAVVRGVAPTVEGALQIAMQSTDFTLQGSRVLVCGYGRIGKLLSHHLQALGASVTVSVRKPADEAWCDVYGYRVIHSDALVGAVGEQDIIFNTVPHLLFDRGTLTAMQRGTLIIDLASAPGGVDFEEAKRQGIAALQALGLPAKVAPRTAGEIICRTISQLYEEEHTRG